MLQAAMLYRVRGQAHRGDGLLAHAVLSCSPIISIPPSVLCPCFCTSLLNSNLENKESKLSGLCWQTADASIRWPGLIETMQLLGVQWEVYISAEREGTRKRDRKSMLWSRRALLYSREPSCREIYLQSFVNQDWTINMGWEILEGSTKFEEIESVK